MAHDESVTDNKHPLDDLAYDWVNVVKNKADALLAYAKYIRDAEAAGSQECAQMFRRMYEEDTRHLAEAKRHLGEVLGGRMGGQSGQSGQRSQSGAGGGQMSHSEVGGGQIGSNTGAQS